MGLNWAFEQDSWGYRTYAAGFLGRILWSIITLWAQFCHKLHYSCKIWTHKPLNLSILGPILTIKRNSHSNNCFSTAPWPQLMLTFALQIAPIADTGSVGPISLSFSQIFAPFSEIVPISAGFAGRGTSSPSSPSENSPPICTITLGYSCFFTVTFKKVTSKQRVWWGLRPHYTL